MKNCFFIHPDSVRSHLVAKKEAAPTTMDSLVEYSKRDRGYVTNIVRDNEHIRFFRTFVLAALCSCFKFDFIDFGSVQVLVYFIVT